MKSFHLITPLETPYLRQVGSLCSTVFSFGVLNIMLMTQLSLFDNTESEKKIDIMCVAHHQPTGMADFNTFLEYNRNCDNTICSLSTSISAGYFKNGKKRIPQFRILSTQYRLSSIMDVKIAKRLLFKFDDDTKEWVHKPIYNYRINQLLHDIYDDLNERSNHV